MARTTKSASSGQSYTARHLSVLEGLEAVRKRPGMYIGSTDSRGLIHCLWEIFDNAVDEALLEESLGRRCTHIDVTLHADESVEVVDNGRGIPVDTEPSTGLSGVEVVFTKLHAGGKFGGGSYAASGGLHGVGASVVNALSARLDVTVRRSGSAHAMSFRRGEPGTFTDRSEPKPTSSFKPFTKSSALRVAGKTKRADTGTTVRFWPDPQIFLKNARVDFADVAARARQTAFLVPGLHITLRDHRGETPVVEEFSFDGGITEFVDHLAVDEPVTDVWCLTGSGEFTESVPVLDDSGRMSHADVTRECGVNIALRWGTGYDTCVKSFVNIIATPKGGTHVSGFEQALTKAVRKMVEKNARRLKAGNDKVEKDDVLAGLTAVVTVRLAEPQFEGQTKEVLGTSDVRGIVAKIVDEQITERLSATKRDEKHQANQVLEKVVSEMKTRISARLHKETQRRKNALESSSLPPKLVDCRSADTEHTELFIVEGDSALGTAKLARSSDYQALLPIRGKILNVQKASVTDMLKNAECASIIQVIGAGSGRTFDLDAARYGKVIVLADADVDGAHIRTLLLTLFFRYMRPLVDAGRVFAAVPPLHRVEVIGKGRAKGEFIYTYSDAELAAVITRLEKRNRRYKEPIQRYKGLGEMDADQLADTTLDRTQRTLRRVTVEDAAAAETTFKLLMGSEVAPRREFIVAGADRLSTDDIDM